MRSKDDRKGGREMMTLEEYKDMHWDELPFDYEEEDSDDEC